MVCFDMLFASPRLTSASSCKILRDATPKSFVILDGTFSVSA